MLGHVLRRLGWSVLTLWFVLSVVFAIGHLLPADPVRVMLGPHADPATVAQVRQQMGLDDPLLVQYGRYLGRALTGDLGVSYRLQRPVTEVLGEAVWPTVQLALGALFIQLLVGVPLGVLSAVRRNRAADTVAQIVSLVGQSAPTFFLGPFLMYLVAYRWGVLPVSGYGEGGLDRLAHLVLPSLTLAAGGTALYTRLVRADLIEALGEDFVRTARAKGASPASVVWRHALRNALLPLVTVVALDLGVLLGGAVVTEYIFSWPGLGREAVSGIMNVDLPVVLGVVLFAAVAIVVVNFVVDLVYAALDPRVRVG